MVRNIIEKNTAVRAPRHVVWSALTEGEHIGQWFGNGQPTRIDPRPGGSIVFDHGGHGDIPAQIETFTPMSTLSYRWAVIGDAGEQPSPSNSTVVTISLEEDGETTSLRLTEVGFENVEATPAELEDRYEANDKGWDRTLADLADYVQKMSRSAV